MSGVYEESLYVAAPSGHVTFSVLDKHCSGNSVSIPSADYRQTVRAVKNTISGLNRKIVFEGALEIARRSVTDASKAECDDNGLFYACISMLLKHPDRRHSEVLIASINAHIKKEEGAHITLIMHQEGKSVWLVGGPEDNKVVH
jgi:hypothetical protein